MVSICKMADMRLLPIIPNLDPVIPGTTARRARPIRHTRVHDSIYVDAQVFAPRLAQYHIDHPTRCHSTCPNYVRPLDCQLKYKGMY